MTKTKRKTDRLLPWFGSNTANAARPAELLAGCTWIGIPFGGGMCEVPHFAAKQILAADLHANVVNLCRVIADDALRAELIRRVDAKPYHPVELMAAQRWCLTHYAPVVGPPDLAIAAHYFTAVWMGRGGDAGTRRELSGGLPIRWDATGGGSNRRYRTAIEAVDAWGEAFRRCEFICQDAFDFLDNVKDKPNIGLYCDPPWPDVGNDYLHQFDEGQQRRLAEVLGQFGNVRIVLRYGEHPLIRELYGNRKWQWIGAAGRNQANDEIAEWLICNGKGSR